MAQRLTTTTQDKLLPKVVDTILGANVLATRILSRAEKWRGGQNINKSIKVSKNTNGGSFSGLDVFSTAEVDNRIKLIFGPKFYHKDVVVQLTELAVNRADEDRIVDLAALELESAAQDMADDIGTMFYGDGTGNSSKDMLGLQAIVDDATSVATYGGQSRSTYTTLKATRTASGGTITLAKMATLYNAITSGSVKPTLGLCNETVWSLIEQLFDSRERIISDVPMMKNGLVGGAGFTGIYYKGVPIIADEKATAQTLYFVNENFLHFSALQMPMSKPINYGVVIDGNDYTNVKGLGFTWTDWIIPTNQAALIGHIYLGGEFWSENPKRHGRLTGITSV